MKTQISCFSRFYISLGAVALSLLVAMPQSVWAQSADATLRGHAPANTQVTAKNVATGVVRRANSGAEGTYTLVGLPPGTYRVDAGAGTEQTVTLAVASTGTLDLTAGGSVAAEGTLDEIVVKSTRLVEVKTSQVGSNVSLHQIQTTPQITRNFLEFADAVPGIVFDVDSRGNTSLKSGAQTAGATNVFIDGIGQKNYVRASGVTGQGGADPSQNPVGDPGNPFPQLAIGEYKVITSNYKAEYDQISGAAITAVTKSGTNEFQAEAFATYYNGSWRASTPAEQASGKGKQGGPSKEYGAAFGGPIIQDKLHYFLTFEGKQLTTPNTVFAPQLLDDAGNTLPVLNWLPAELLSNYGPVSNPFKESLYFGKLDWEVTDADRLELTAKYRRERQQVGSAGVIAASAASTYVNDEQRFQLRWEHSSGSRFNETTLAFEKTNDSPSKISNNPGIQYVAFGTAGNGFSPILQTDGVNPENYFLTAQKGFSLQNDLTISDLAWHGDHTLKTGIKFKSVKLEDRDAGAAPLYSYYVSPTGVDPDPFQVKFGAQGDPNLPTISSSKNRQFGVYFQDDWAIGDRLVLNLGVRYDYEQTPTYTNYVTPKRFVDAINSQDTNYDLDANGQINRNGGAGSNYYWNGAYHGADLGQTYAQTLAKGGVNINDYISTGNNRKNPSNEIAPRLGFSFDINADQRHVIFGGAGRSYDRNVWGILQHETNKATLYLPTVQFLTDKNPNCATPADITPTCIPFSDAYLTPDGLQSAAPGAFGEMHFIKNNIKAPYSDQFSIGMRNRLGAWNTSVAVARILSHDGLIARLGNFFGDGTWYWYDTGNWSGYTGGVANANGGFIYLFENAKESRTTQLLVSFDKPYTRESRWFASIGYTFSKAQEKLVSNGDYQFDYADSRQSPFVRSNQVPKHRLVAVGSIDAPWGITVGAKFVLETPRAFTAFDGNNLAPANGFNSQYLKVSQFPTNKLGYKTLDLQLSKDFTLPGSFSMLLRLDVLNVFNTRNYAQYTDGYPDRPYYFVDGNISGVPRTLKLTMNMKL